MILVTVGTNEQPFDRLVRWAAALEGDEPLLVQHGSSTVPHGRGEWIDFLPFEELSERAQPPERWCATRGWGRSCWPAAAGTARSWWPAAAGWARPSTTTS